MYRIVQTILDVALISLRPHVDEVDYDEAAKIPNSQLTSNFVGCFEVGVQGRRFNIAALGCSSRVNVDRDQRFGVIDNDAAARR